MTPKTNIGFALNLLLLFFAVASASRTSAQEKKSALPPHFSDHVAAKFHLQSLTQIVTALDKQAGLNILIDGEPLTPLADVECEGTLEEALNKIADTFDYNWTVSKGGIVLFNKRFRNRNDAPQANLPELTHMVNNMSVIFHLAKVDPDPTLWTIHLNQLGKSLTEKQRAILLTGKRMPASDLSPDQLLHLRMAVLNNTFGSPMRTWGDLSDHLRTFKNAYISAERAPDNDPILPGVPRYGYQIFWNDREGSLSSDNIFLQVFGLD